MRENGVGWNYRFGGVVVKVEVDVGWLEKEAGYLVEASLGIGI